MLQLSKSAVVRGIAAVAIVTAMLALVLPAAAQPCGSRQFMLQELTVTLQLKRAATGLMLTGQLLEVYVSATGAWTLVVTTPTGISCITGLGEHWQQFSPHVTASR